MKKRLILAGLVLLTSANVMAEGPVKPPSAEISTELMTWEIKTPNAYDAQSCQDEAQEALQSDPRTAKMSSDMFASLAASIEDNCKSSWETFERESIIWSQRQQDEEIKKRNTIKIDFVGHTKYQNGEQTMLFYEVAGSWSRKVRYGQVDTYIKADENRGEDMAGNRSRSAGISYERDMVDPAKARFGKVDYSSHQANGTETLDVLFGGGIAVWGDDYSGEEKLTVSGAGGGTYDFITGTSKPVVSILAKYQIEVVGGKVELSAKSIIPVEDNGFSSRRDSLSIGYEKALNKVLSAKVGVDCYWDHNPASRMNECVYKTGLSAKFDGL